MNRISGQSDRLFEKTAQVRATVQLPDGRLSVIYFFVARRRGIAYGYAVIQELSGFLTGYINWINNVPVSAGFMSLGGDIVGAFVWYDALCRLA